MTKDRYIPVTEHPVTEYACGLKAGDTVQLKKDLICRDHRGRATGEIHKRGELWTVLSGTNQGRTDVWFRQPDGRTHTWDDDMGSIDQWFERVNVSE